MAFSVRNTRVEDKARAYSARQGTTLAGALKLALDKAMRQPTKPTFDDPEKEAAYQEWLRQIREIQERVAKPPDTGLTGQDVMGWDENGLPT